MFLDLLYRLRTLGVPVGTAEALALAKALSAGVHGQTPEGFYHTARALLVHHEEHLDAFDRAFAATYRGEEMPELEESVLAWLDGLREQRGENAQVPELDELVEELRQRLAEQTQRHEGGSYWVGTQGTSPFGRAGYGAAGLSAGSSGGGRSAVHIADARHYRAYRSDAVLDTRQFEVALRRLRSFVRSGAPTELDIDETIDATARNAGDIEVVTRPPRHPDTHLILLADVGGSMHPYTHLMSQLLSAVKRATHFKELRTYYFHNCVYGKVYGSERFTEPVWVHDLLRECGTHYSLMVVGDALMAPYELEQASQWSATDPARVAGWEWLQMLREHFTRSVWINPEHESHWPGSTIEDIANIFDMYPMTMDGLTQSMTRLNRGLPARR